MSRRISDQTKNKRKMGTGKGASYLPYITVNEFNSRGTASVIKDWKTGRGVHCLSQGEALWYYVLRWDDNNTDIREQYPLDNESTRKIASENGIKHPHSETHIMTTDFLITKSDGSLHAYSVKPNKNLSERELQILCIEKIYWTSRGCGFDMLFKTDVNLILASNVRIVTEFYNPDSVFDKYSAIKHKIARKEYPFDMKHELINNTLLDNVWRANQ
ncbi:MAG: TnsA endonuclease N-terminal domain-containing protein [Lachnospiraceae bacterium]|nr:TnsA endonuclease N-terminal domain-containing protein [Lachnospiraceae bacterium]